MLREPAGHTLQPTALVHEAWLRLGGASDARWEDRAHFFGAAAEAMRRILIDRARSKLALRNGAGQLHADVAELAIAAPGPDDELLAMHEALEKFAMQEPRKAELVKLRYFGGLNFEEAADVLGISVPTAKRDWAFARAWLFREITDNR
jgi:RNA polymerase sigma factor (TIGR02999 family)